MTSVQFAYWLQGVFEVMDPKELNKKQVQIIKNHLNLVFYHEIDPSASKDLKVQEEMNEIHNGNEKLFNKMITSGPDGITKKSSFLNGDNKEHTYRC